MNLLTPTTMGEFRRMIATADDLAGAHVLWIDTCGEVHLSPEAQQQRDGNAQAAQSRHADVRLRFAPFQAGAGMVGPQAAHDDRLIGNMYFSVLHHWLQAGGAPPGALDAELDDLEQPSGWKAAINTGSGNPLPNTATRRRACGARMC